MIPVRTLPAVWLAGLCSALSLASPAVAAETPPSCPELASCSCGLPRAARDDALLPWLGFQYHTGPGVGYTTSYSDLNGFVPLLQGTTSLVFVEMHGLLSDTTLLGSNAGGGYRRYDPERNRLFGINGFYDYRDAGHHSFHQLGLGLESLGEVWDFRSNVYLPISQDQKEVYAVFSQPMLVGHNILLNKFSAFQAAMLGADLEVGRPLPVLGRYGFKGYLGGYHYQVENSPQAFGVRGRLEARITDNLDLNLSVSNDRVFGTNVVCEVRLRFGGSGTRSGAARGDVSSRRADPVERNHVVVVTDQTLSRQVPATNPTDDQPVVVQTVSSLAAPGGDGTFEHPFQTLAQLQAASRPGQILLVYSNSVFTGQSITLQDGQRLLAEGRPVLVNTGQGTWLLPRITTGTFAPVLRDSPGNAITLANNNEVAGFVITGAKSNGIFGNAVTGFNLHDNMITGAGVQGIALQAINGTGTIANNVASGNGSEGIFVDSVAFTGSVTGNIANDNGSQPGGFTTGVGIEVSHTSGGAAASALPGSSFTGTIANNTASNNGTGGSAGIAGTGILVSVDKFNGSIAGNTTNDNGTGARGAMAGAGISVMTTTFTGDVVNNVANNNGTGASAAIVGPGIGISTTTFIGNIAGNTANGNSRGANAAENGVGLGITARTMQGDITGNTTNENGIGARAALSGPALNISVGQFNGNITNNTANNNGGGSMGVSAGNGIGVAGSTFNGNFSGNVANNNSQTGISLGGSFPGSVANNTANGNGGDGISVASTGFSSAGSTGVYGNLTNNIASNNGQNGISIRDVTFTGTIAGNTLSGNGREGMNVFPESFFGPPGSGLQSNTFRIVNNQFSGNNGGTGSELLAERTGSGNLFLLLEGNTSSNRLGAGPPFNYDLRNHPGGTFVLQQGTNVGTVGSGDRFASFPTPGIVP
jgi:parallel beta-helix repeat protein